jgi:hypothetical protein
MKTWKKFALFQIVAMLVANSALPATVEVPDWLTKSGFKAILGSLQDQDFIYIESRADGLVFRHCEMDDQPDVIAGNAMPDTCPTFLNNDSIAVPADLLMKGALGLKRIMLTTGKVALGGGIIVLESMTWGYASDSAAAVDSIIPSNPIQDVQDLTKAQKTMRDLVKYGNQSNQTKDGQIVTELLRDPYDEIKEGVTEELLGVVKEMLKNDKTLDAKWKAAYHTLINERYAQLLNKKPAVTPAPQPSGQPSGQP